MVASTKKRLSSNLGPLQQRSEKDTQVRNAFASLRYGGGFRAGAIALGLALAACSSGEPEGTRATSSASSIPAGSSGRCVSYNDCSVAYRQTSRSSCLASIPTEAGVAVTACTWTARGARCHPPGTCFAANTQEACLGVPGGLCEWRHSDGEFYCTDNFDCPPSSTTTEAQCAAASPACVWEQTPCVQTTPCPTDPNTTQDECQRASVECFWNPN